MVSFGFLLTLYALFTPFGHCFSLFKRKDGLKVLSPNSSDRFTTGIDFLIRWEVSDESSVKLEVRKGFPENLTTVHVISQNTSNNGSYQWRSRDDSFLKGNGLSRLPYTPPSGCDYTIAIDDSRTTVNSEYFTIISVRDDGLPSDVACPNVTAGPQNSSGGGGGNGGSGNGSGQGSDNNQVTTAMLGGAVAGTAGGLILGFAVILLLGRSRGWFVSEAYVRNIVAGHLPLIQYAPHQELELSSAPVYQMPGRPHEK